MLKRLLIAVFVLGLFLTLSGTAFSDIGKGPLNPVIKVDQSNARFNDLSDARPQNELPMQSKIPGSALQAITPQAVPPTPASGSFCTSQWYHNGGAAFYFQDPDYFGAPFSVGLNNVRFTSDPGYVCSLKTAWVLTYGAATVGDPTLRVYLWDDDGFGFPLNKLDSVDVPYASYYAGGGFNWAGADFTHGGTVDHIFSDGEEYHIGFASIANSPDDSLGFLTDDGTGHDGATPLRNQVWLGGGGTDFWIEYAGLLSSGSDVGLLIEADLCKFEIPFSDCHWESYWSNIAYFWRAPHIVYGDSSYAQRFSVSGPETLMLVDMYVYDDAGSPSATDVFGNNTVNCTIYDDAGGVPGATVASLSIAPAGYPAFPAATTFDFSASNLVFTSDFWVAFSSDGSFASSTYEACLSSDGSDGLGRSASNWDTTGFGDYGWVDMLSGWGVDVNFLFDAYLCKDEFSICGTGPDCLNGLNFFWRLPDAWGDVADAQMRAAVGTECRVERVRWALYDNGSPNAYTDSSRISVYSDAGGLPGAELAGVTLQPADYILFPANQEVDFTGLPGGGVSVSGLYWIVIESYSPDSALGIRTLSDAGGGGCDLQSAEFWGIWAYMGPDWGLPDDIAFIAESDHCCIPFPERDCAGAGEQWSTLGHDQGRTSASENSVSDSWCDLTEVWTYEDPVQGVQFTSPIIHGDAVVQSFSDHYIKFDLASGAPIYTLTGAPWGSSIRCAPSVATIDIGGTPTEVMFTSGGSDRSIIAVDYATGAIIWSRDISTVGIGGLYGNTRWGVFTVLNFGGIDVVYWGTDDGAVVAAEAATGTLYAGWGVNPVYLNASTFKSGATDGSSLFYGTWPSAGTDGDIYSLDAATGAINWQLSSSGGLQAALMWTPNPSAAESFQSGVAYEGGALYSQADFGVGSSPGSDFPADGVFYSINASNGSLNFSVGASTGLRYANVVVDANHVYVGALSHWLNPPPGGNLYAVNRGLGTIDWVQPQLTGEGYWTDGALSCEPLGAPDQLFWLDDEAFLRCVNSTNGDEMWRRRVDQPSTLPGGAALAPSSLGDIYLAVADFWGDVYVLSKGVDRPRLEIQTYSPAVPVEFGPATSLPVPLPGIFTNTGCTDLTVSDLLFDDVDPGVGIPSFSITTIRPDVDAFAQSIAVSLAPNADKFAGLLSRKTLVDGQDSPIVSAREINRRSEISNKAASAFPAILNSPGYHATSPMPGILAAGDTTDVVLDVQQVNITRGPSQFFMSVVSDDPDFFLNDVLRLPVVQVTLVGGCLLDVESLAFGVGAANTRTVYNTSALGDFNLVGGAAGDPTGFDVDGDFASYFGGSLIYGVSTHRVAMSAPLWDGSGEQLISSQADPNWCDNSCHPFLDAGVSLMYGTIPVGITSDGGVSYTQIVANIVCATYLDSVQNFDDGGGGWDWTSPSTAPFDNDSTVGLMVQSTTVGTIDVPELHGVTIEKMEITERNGDSVTGWYLGSFADYDNGGDTTNYGAAVSGGWAYSPGSDVVWGETKIPFGCLNTQGETFDNAPAINSHGMIGPQALWDVNAYFDSAYSFMSTLSGASAQVMSAGDGEMHMTFASHDFAGGETYSVGVAHYRQSGVANPDDPNSPELVALSKLVNQFAGFGRGDMDNDGNYNIADVVILGAHVNAGGPGAIPFQHLGDVDASGAIDQLDVDYLANFIMCGPCPKGGWTF